MVYGTNILPGDAEQYQLTRASISNGVMSIEAGGSVKCVINRAQLGSLSEYFKVNLAPLKFTDSYEPRVHVRIEVETTGKCYSYVLFPVKSNNGVYSTELEFDEADYTQFVFEIVANETVSFALWELCPQSTGDVEVIIDGVKQSLPKLLYDYNTTDIVVEQSEQIIGMINCYLIDSTDLQGHFLMNFTATDRCTVHLRFYDSAMIELFSPIVHTVNNGYNTLEVPHAYLNKNAGTHSFYVTAQVTNGSLTVPIRGILYTIDGGYLAERLLNPGMDVCDVSVMQLSSDKEPSEIWAIGVDNGQVIVKKRPYDLSKPNLAWDAVYLLGEGTLGAIEFDGAWVRRTGATAHTLETHALPTIAFVDKIGKLLVYQHGMYGDPIEMDTNVTCVSMVRGYKSESFVEQDQGLVLCWIKDGNVFYRQYAYFNGSYQWCPIEQLTTSGDVTFVQVHRLNDYRIGIVTQTATENHWYITGRTYVSQAVPTEIVKNSVDGLCGFITMTKQEEAEISFEAIPNVFAAVDAAQSDFYITFKYPKRIELYKDTLAQWKAAMTVKVGSRTLTTDEYDVMLENATLHVRLAEPTWGTVQISWNRIGILFFLDSYRYIINTQASYSFTWNVWRSYSHEQPIQTFAAKVGGNLAFHYTEVGKLGSNPREATTANIAGTLLFQYIEVNKPQSARAESTYATITGEATFTLILIGDKPI